MRKKIILSLCMAAAVCMSVSCFTACSSDNNNDPTTPVEEKATAVTISPVVYVTASELKYFDVNVTDVSGKTVKLSTDNTAEPSSLVSSVFLGNSSTLKSTVEANPGDKLLAYTIPVETIKSFPAERTYTVSRIYNGTQLEDGKKILLVMLPTAEAKPNKGEFSSFKGSIMASTSSVSSQSSLDKSVGKTFTTAVTYKFANASSIDFATSK